MSRQKSLKFSLHLPRIYQESDSNASATAILRSRLAGFEGRCVGVIFSETGQRPGLWKYHVESGSIT